MKIFQRESATVVRASGYPETDAVSAKLIKKSGVLVLKNGYNLFQIQSLQFPEISVLAGSNGSFDLVGFDSSSVASTLASFGSRKAATNALDKVSLEYAGIRSGVRWARWVIGAVVLYAVLESFSGAAVSATERLHAQDQGSNRPKSTQPATPIIPSTQLAAAQDDGSAQENPNVGSMSEAEMTRLGNGGQYHYNPKLTMPNVPPPNLSCADATSK